MREIKFRIWDKSEGYWSEGLSIHLHCSGRSLNIPPSLVLQQWTGLQDKHGKDIYEGDIVKWNIFTESLETTSVIDVVEFRRGLFATKTRHQILATIIEPHRNLKVIGNIYEDPHLINT